MKRVICSITWVFGFFVAAILLAGFVNSLIIICGLPAVLGDGWAGLCVWLTDLILLMAIGTGIYLTVKGRLPGTRGDRSDDKTRKAS